jgi:DHA1 family tetracycline resistance protein-like MFS transporter
LADITVENDRNLNFGKMTISENLEFVVDPALAGILSVIE